MEAKNRISIWLEKQKDLVFILWCIAGAFITYFSMYAFRKPFSAALYEGILLWGMPYKVVLIISQVMGYTCSKFLGIKVVSEMPPERRARYILLLIGLSWLALLCLGIVPAPYNFLFLFLNGLPLGMIWGLVFDFIEGRKNTELLAAGLASSFIVASGVVKSIGLSFVLNGVSEFWMPFLTGFCFIPSLLLGVWMLTKIPPPTQLDEALRTKRTPMNAQERWAFFRTFAPGIILMTLVYIALNAYRDFRDNFAVEIWKDLGYAEQPEMLTYSEVPIAIVVLIIIAAMIFVQNHRLVFYTNLVVIGLGGLTVLLTTYFFVNGYLHPAIWMISVGFGMYLAYISYNVVLFERWIALFKYVSNIGFLMYISDSFGYLGSVAVMLYQHFFQSTLSWLDFFVEISYAMGIISLVLSAVALIYFYKKELRHTKTPMN